MVNTVSNGPGSTTAEDEMTRFASTACTPAGDSNIKEEKTTKKQQTVSDLVKDELLETA